MKMRQHSSSTEVTEGSIEEIPLDQDDDAMQDRVPLHQLNLSSAQLERRQKEKDMRTAEEAKTKAKKEMKKRQKQEERQRDMEMLLNYDPWGKPGAGAPRDDLRRKNLHPFNINPTNEDEKSLLRFGRPGAGAPIRTRSGKLLTQLPADNSIRFQNNDQGRVNVENRLRYKNVDKLAYRSSLDNLLQEKAQAKEKAKMMEKQQVEDMDKNYPFGKKGQIPKSISSSRRGSFEDDGYHPWGKGFGNPLRDERGYVKRTKENKEGGDSPELGVTLPIGERKNSVGNGRVRARKSSQNGEMNGNHVTPEDEYNPWGRPGAGAPFKPDPSSRIPFQEKMGWSLSNEAIKKTKEQNKEYLKFLQEEIENKKERQRNNFTYEEEKTTDLASLMTEKVVGKPKRDPNTGQLLPNPKKISDITSHKYNIRSFKSQDSPEYCNFLLQQAEARQKERQSQKDLERKEIEQHVEAWNTFWGKPGAGAPRDERNHKLEGLHKLLLKSHQQNGNGYVKLYSHPVLPSKHKNRYESHLSTENVKNMPKKQYEFKVPWATTI